jgi:ADP-ribose pyrophosphatase YjhB (NUDIX family)
MTCANGRATGSSALARPRIVIRALQRYWRLTRGLTLGAQAVLIDPDNRVLLIRHTYRPGWHFPGGGVECGETVEDALNREIDEEAAVALNEPAQLFGVYSNAALFPNDHVVLFVSRAWRHIRVPKPNREIAEQRLFAPDAVPADINPGTARRLAEIFSAKPRSPMW